MNTKPKDTWIAVVASFALPAAALAVLAAAIIMEALKCTA